jgi:hypothetical protein
MDYRVRLALARHDARHRLERLALNAWRRLPEDWRHKATCWELGALTTTPRLRGREVPTITVDELLAAMRDPAAA